jgi:hypothetical protein
VHKLALFVFSVGGALVTQDANSHNPITTTVRFNREVVRIFNSRCSSCHADGGMAMPLQRYEQARPWVESIKEEVLARRMPPWPAERGYGEFANDSGLTQREMEFLLSWIDGGAPEGDDSPPEPVDHGGHWMLGAPDVEHKIAVASEDSAPPGFRRYIADLGGTDSVSVRAFELKVDDPRVHAAFLSVVGTGQYIGGWTPTQSFTDFPRGTALHLNAGARIAVDVLHLQPVGTLRLGLYFGSRDDARIGNISLRSSAMDDRGRVRGRHVLSTTQTILGFRVDLSRGLKSLELNARTPAGAFKPLLMIRNVRPEWPTPFVLKTPLRLPQGSTLQAVAYFDPVQAGAADFDVAFVTTDGSEATIATPHDHAHLHAH